MNKLAFSFFIVFVLTSTKILGQSITMGGIFPTIDHSGTINQKFDYGLYYFAAIEMEGLRFVGYGNWTGYASATLIGINRNVKQAVLEIEMYLKNREIQII